MGFSGCGKCSNVPIRGIISVVGCAMVVFCFGIEHTFSNMNPYMTSYLRNRSLHSPDVSYGDTLWVSTGTIVSASFFMPILCLLEQVIPSKICILVGVWTFSTGMAVTYFSISNGFIAIIFTEGVVHTIGRALAYPVTLRMALRWFPERRGVICGILAACSGGSAFAFNQIITKFINPDNLSPDQDVRDNRYFTQASLLDKVPYCYLLIGSILAVISTTGVLIMTDPGQKPQNTSDNKSSEEKVELPEIDLPEKTSPDTDSKKDLEKSIPCDLSPKQTLQTCRFYNAWFMYFFVGFGLDIFAVLFKPYGETFITDDYFLSLVASCGAVAMAIGNLTWGFLADKFTYKVSADYIGMFCLVLCWYFIIDVSPSSVKHYIESGKDPVLMILICIFGTFLSTLMTTEHGGKPMFFIWVFAIDFSFSGVFVLLPLIAMDMFGSKYLSVNYGLIHSAGVAFSLLSALLTSQLKDIVGWHGIFLFAAGMTIISFLLAAGIYTQKKWDR